MTGMTAVVVGAGPAGREKTVRLLAAGAAVRMVDPHPPTHLPDGVELVARGFDVEDVRDAALVVAATSDSSVNERVAEAARSAGALVVRADSSSAGGASFAATLVEGPVLVGVSTGGASPAFARWVRDRVANVVTREVGVLAELLGDRPRRNGRRRHRGLRFDSALEALESGDVARARAVLDE